MRPYLLIITGIFILSCGVATLPLSPVAEKQARADMRVQFVTPTPRVVVNAEDYYTLGDPLNVRESPSTDSAVLGYFEYGTKVTVIGAVKETPDVLDCPRWYNVVFETVETVDTFDDNSAWVCAEWVTDNFGGLIR